VTSTDVPEGPPGHVAAPCSLPLASALAADPAITGRKAAALALAAGHGIPTLAGAVLTTAFTAEIDGGADVAVHPSTREVFGLVGGDVRPLVVRSSSTTEDSATSSMAGQFASVIGTAGFDEFVAAVHEVLGSRGAVGGCTGPLAVLVQTLIEPRWGGVLFGVDPVSGRTDRRVISAVDGGPEPLVSGAVAGSHYVVDPSGAVLERDEHDGTTLDEPTIRSLVGLAATAERVFGSPQDIEWAIGDDGRLWLLQSRPVTTEARGVPSGPIFGPGPVAETFPETVSRLEADLWVPPLRDAVIETLRLTGTVPPKELAASPVVVVIDGHVAIDLRLVGEIPVRLSLLQRVSPVAGVARIGRAWRVGRLRAALPALAEDLLDRADADLESVPPLGTLTSRQLLAVLTRGQQALRALHAHEILMGALMHPDDPRLTAASVALRVLAEAREDGMSDDQIKQQSPVVLALTAPRVAPDVELPAATRSTGVSPSQEQSSDGAVLREALRLRVRWVQELMGRAAWLLGLRLAP
jgi:hypothetical protein